MLLCLPPLTLEHVEFPWWHRLGLCSIRGICVQPCLVYLLDIFAAPWTEAGPKEASVNVCRREMTASASGAVQTSRIMLFETILQELIIQLLPQLIPELQLLPHLPAYLLAILPLISAFHESKLGRKKMWNSNDCRFDSRRRQIIQSDSRFLYYL